MVVVLVSCVVCVVRLIICFRDLGESSLMIVYSLFSLQFGLFVYNSVDCVVRVNIVSIVYL